MPNSSHRSAPRSSVRAAQTPRATGPAFPSCPLSARPVENDHRGSSPSWEDLLGRR